MFCRSAHPWYWHSRPLRWPSTNFVTWSLKSILRHRKSISRKVTGVNISMTTYGQAGHIRCCSHMFIDVTLPFVSIVTSIEYVKMPMKLETAWHEAARQQSIPCSRANTPLWARLSTLYSAQARLQTSVQASQDHVPVTAAPGVWRSSYSSIACGVHVRKRTQSRTCTCFHGDSTLTYTR